MSKVVLILAAVIGCSAQQPHVLSPVNYNNGPNPWQGQPQWNAQQWNGQQNPWQNQQWNGQQNPWQNQPRNFYPQYNPYSYQGTQQPWQNQPRNFYPQYNPYQNSQQQQPWNNNNFNRWPQMQNPMQNSNSCNNELQACFNQMPEYWAAVQSIENNPVLTKEEARDHKKTLVRRLPDDVQNCYKNAESNVKKCAKQRQNTNGLSNDAQKAFSKIKNIQNNKRLTKQDECHQIGNLLQSLNPSVTNELLNRMPELRQHMQFNPNQMYPNQMNQNPYNNMYPNQMNQNPYNNMYPNQMYPNYQFTQFNRNERKQ
ncbi:hypothetical protein M3Y97_00735000 [Aphelenchoides bicaudatus]|nr:hypothetical protein M3Y97_00735000 [Aphelenchoides bicaudatus]